VGQLAKVFKLDRKGLVKILNEYRKQK